VALDATPLLGVSTGVGAFCSGALGALSVREDVEVSAFAVSWRRRHELSGRLPPGVANTQRAMPARPLHLLWSHSNLAPVEWFVGRLDVVHGTNYVVPPSRAARVVTVHDLTSLRYPQLCDKASLAFPGLVRRAASEGAWVHTPSRFVAEEVVSELGVDPSRVRAVHHGIPGARDAAPGAEPAFTQEPLATRELGGGVVGDDRLPAGRYVLAIGTIEPRKDYPLLVRAFDALAAQLDDVALVIAGADGWGVASLEAALEAATFSDRVLRLGFVAAERLGPLLSAASLVAYPSVYEGFGLVPLEAMAAGVPVVATAAGAIPEVVGDGALLVPQGDEDALCDAMRTLLVDDRLRALMVERGRLRSSTFSWSACAEGLSSLYREAAR
jgi:glycosyltransferase involved in cell wall biosynthesis